MSRDQEECFALHIWRDAILICPVVGESPDPQIRDLETGADLQLVCVTQVSSLGKIGLRQKLGI